MMVLLLSLEVLGGDDVVGDVHRVGDYPVLGGRILPVGQCRRQILIEVSVRRADSFTFEVATIPFTFRLPYCRVLSFPEISNMTAVTKHASQKT